MWWPVVFWLLLIPLLIVETIIFLKTRKLFWLIYALSIFTYVVSVSYTLDVFDAGRNAVITTLLGSAVLMALIGRQLGRSVKKRKSVSHGTRMLVISALTLMALIFAVSVIFGKAAETVTPVASVDGGALIDTVGKAIEPRIPARIPLLTRTLTNEFFLPVPVVSKGYKACVSNPDGVIELWGTEEYAEYDEVPAFSTKEVTVYVQPYSTDRAFTADEVLVYALGKDQYMPCDTITSEPAYRIPVV